MDHSTPEVRITVTIRPEIRDQLSDDKIHSRTLKNRLLRVLAHPKVSSALPPLSELCITLMGDDEIRELNRDYRQKDRATDVLSFSLLEGEALVLPEEVPIPLGDLMISVETAARQAERGALPRLSPALRSSGWSVDSEVSFLALHGLLHLLGYDHEDDEEADIMEGVELSLLGILLPRSARTLD